MAENIEAVKTYWEAHPTRGKWNTYEEEMADVYIKERCIPDSIDQLPLRGKLVLDAGSGQGTHLYYMLKKGARAYGFDISATAIASSHDKLQKGGFSRQHAFQGNAEHMPFRNNVFDCAISIGVLHHTPNIGAAASELHRVIKPGGTACLLLYKKNRIILFRQVKHLVKTKSSLYLRLKPVKEPVEESRNWQKVLDARYSCESCLESYSAELAENSPDVAL